ncbi:MAG: trypsin-like peptidase domain-containing protein [Lachnospiraceae bacterium]|nr:trypsin-like peptidase domain-containing protein [Lachnospiraceae bacterium]
MKNKNLWQKLGLTAAMGATFGLVASGVFFSVNNITEATTKTSTVIETTAETGEGPETGATQNTIFNRDNGGASSSESGKDDADESSVAEKFFSFFGNDEQDAEAKNEEETDDSALFGKTESDANTDGDVASTEEANETDTAANGTMTVAEVAANSMPAMVAITNTSIQNLQSYYGGYGDYADIFGDIFGNGYGSFFGNGNGYGGYSGGMFGSSYENTVGDMQGMESVSMGTGVIIDETDDQLIIVTNQHVIDSANELSVAFIDENAASATVLGEDASSDLAVIAVNKADLSADTLSAIRVISIGNSDSTMVGEQVVAIGNALGYGQSVSTGIVSALHRTLESYDGTREGTDDGLIQTDAAINPGNSGGALLNMKGELIGINSAKYADTDVEGMGYAIPITSALPILESLRNGEAAQINQSANSNTVRLGISCTGISEEYSSYYGIPAGVYVKEVEQGSAAANAVIKEGDIITSLGDVTVKSVEDLTEALKAYKPGDSAEITVSREVSRQDIFAEGGTSESYQSGTTTVTFGTGEAKKASLNEQ